MEPVAPNAVLIENPWQGIAVRMSSVATMEGRIETGDLGNIRIDVHGEADWCQIVGLMQRCKLLWRACRGCHVRSGSVAQNPARRGPRGGRWP
jgi:hypothetical protein